MDIDEEYFKSEDFRELLTSYETSVHTGSHPFMDVDDLVDIADYYSFYGQQEKAEEVVNYALELYPHATLPNVFMARRALMDKHFELAEQYASQIESHDDPDYHYLKAEILIAQDRIDEADRYLDNYGRSVERDEYDDFVKDCANLFIDYNHSFKAFQWIMRSNDDKSDDYKELKARALFGMGEYKYSEQLFNELIDHNPFSKTYWKALASVQFMREDYSGSITSSEYAIAIDPQEPDSVLTKANGLFQLGNLEESLKWFQRYEEMRPDDEFGLLHQALCMISLNQCDEGLEKLDAALAIAPQDSPYLAQIYQEKAFCYNAKKMPEEALKMIDKTDGLDCDHNEMMVVRGHILLQNELDERAFKCFEKAAIDSKSAPYILLHIGVSLYENNRIEACYDFMKVVFECIKSYTPRFTGGYALMALCCFDLGHKEEFLSNLKLAVEKTPAEARSMLSCLFPDDVKVSDYYEYMQELLKD